MITGKLTKHNEGGKTFYRLKLEGGHETTEDFRKLYESELQIYPDKHSYGVKGMQSISEIEFLIVCGEQR